MTVIASIIALVFTLLGLLHFYWAAGGKVGIKKVIPEVNGEPAMNPGTIVTIVVAVGLLGVAGVSYLLGHYDLAQHEYGSYVIYAGWGLAVIMLIRAIGDFKLVGFFKRIKSSEFSVYDTKYYSPFCLVVSVSFSTLSYSRAVTVGTLIYQRPPHRSPHEVFPHGAPRLYSLSQSAKIS